MRPTIIRTVLAIGVAAISISIAPAAAADPSHCKIVGGTTICGQGSVGNNGGGSPTPATSAPNVGCTNPYGSYQNCQS